MLHACSIMSSQKQPNHAPLERRRGVQEPTRLSCAALGGVAVSGLLGRWVDARALCGYMQIPRLPAAHCFSPPRSAMRTVISSTCLPHLGEGRGGGCTMHNLLHHAPHNHGLRPQLIFATHPYKATQRRQGRRAVHTYRQHLVSYPPRRVFVRVGCGGEAVIRSLEQLSRPRRASHVPCPSTTSSVTTAQPRRIPTLPRGGGGQLSSTSTMGNSGERPYQARNPETRSCSPPSPPPPPPLINHHRYHHHHHYHAATRCAALRSTPDPDRGGAYPFGILVLALAVRAEGLS